MDEHCSQGMNIVHKGWTLSTRDELSPQWMNFVPKGWTLSPRDELCPQWVNFVPNGWTLSHRGKVIQGGMIPSVHPFIILKRRVCRPRALGWTKRWTFPLWIKKVHPCGPTSPLNINFTPEYKLHPWIWTSPLNINFTPEYKLHP
jgi:hypothetical protein